MCGVGSLDRFREGTEIWVRRSVSRLSTRTTTSGSTIRSSGMGFTTQPSSGCGIWPYSAAVSSCLSRFRSRFNFREYQARRVGRGRTDTSRRKGATVSAPRRGPHQSGKFRHLRRQILHGLHRAEGTDARLDRLVRDERFQPLKLPLFGLLPARAVIARIEAEKEEAAKPKTEESWPQRFRLKTEYQVHDIRAKGGRTVLAKRPITVGDRDVFPGEEVELNKSQATIYEHLIEPWSRSGGAILRAAGRSLNVRRCSPRVVGRRGHIPANDGP